MRPGTNTQPRPPGRRGLTVTAGLAALTLAVSACGGGGGGSDDGTVELRFSWWGADDRHATTEEVIELFEEQHPNISVSGEYTDWDSYWDRLATNVAANDSPDIITQEERYLREYAERNALLDLAEYSEQLDTASIDPLALDGGEMDGGLYGVATGVNAWAILADPEIFDEAGVDMPDDTTWTWEEFGEIAAEISDNTDDDVYGAQTIFNEAAFHTFARQNGQSLYSDDGQLGFTADLLAEWWEMLLERIDSGAEPDAALTVEVDGGGPDQSLLATNRGAMGHWWTNQLAAIAETADRDLELLRYPGESEGERTGMYFKPAMYYSVAADTEHPEEAALFVDFLLNSQEAADLILSDRGLPANLEVRESILDDLPPADAQSATFLAEIEADILDAPPVPPIGAGEVIDIVDRYNEEVIFERLTPREAAEQFMAEVDEVIG